ncbi:MAG: alpha/beta hydrolase fold domain-containing protein [Treponema sp.]|nr:alpha/beta hydrolase fold domain-containing protein [Treponema sp.]
MKNDRKAAVKKLKTLVLNQKIEIEKFRTKLEKTFCDTFIPNHVECVTRDCGGIKCDFLSPEAFASNRIIIYIHGGSFVGGSCASYRSFCASFANAASCRMLVPEFRLPPTFSFPSGVEDLESVIRSFFIQDEVESHFNKERGGTNVILAADGSGASLAFALIQKLSKENLSKIKKIILFSPWLDFSPDSPVFLEGKKHDEILTTEGLRRSVEAYTYESNHVSPLVSPNLMPEDKVRLLPPIYIQCGKKEMLLDQIHEFENLLVSCGVACTVDEVEDMMSMFQMADEYLSESHLALERVGNYIKNRSGLDEDELREREIIIKRNNIFQE